MEIIKSFGIPQCPLQTFLKHVDGLGEAVDILLKVVHIEGIEGACGPVVSQMIPFFLRLPQEAAERQVSLNLWKIGLDLLAAVVSVLPVHKEELPLQI